LWFIIHSSVYISQKDLFLWQLSDLDFRDSVLTLGFSEEHQKTLEVFYKGKKQEICDALSQLTLDRPHYHDLDWRFEVQASFWVLFTTVEPHAC
jgi:hypothetical protein